MSWQAPPILILFQMGVFLTAGIAVYSLRYMRRHGRSELVTVIAVLAAVDLVWTLSAALKIASVGLFWKLLFYKVHQIAVSFAPPLTVLMVLYYTDRKRWVNRWTLAFLSVIPLVMVLTVPTNPAQLLFIEPEVVTVRGWRTLEHGFGPVFMLFLGGSFLTMGVALVIVVSDALAGNLPRTPALLLSAAWLCPMAPAMLKAFDIYPPGGAGISITPAINAVGIAIAAVAVFRYRLHELTPIAKDRAIDTMREGFVVVDGRGHIVDSNPAAAALLRAESPQALRERQITDVVPEFDRLDGETGEFERGDRILQATRSRLDDRTGAEGWLVVLHDITTLRRQADRIRSESESKQAVMSLLTQVSTRRAVAEGVCRLLVDHHGYDCAFVATDDADGLEPTVVRGDCADSVTEAALVDTPVGQAFEKGATVPMPTTGELGPGVAVPVTHAGITYGVVTVLDEAAADATELVESFAAAIGYKAYTVAQRDALLTDVSTRLELTIRDEDCYLLALGSRVSPAADGSVTVHERGPAADGDTQLLDVRGGSGDDIAQAADDTSIRVDDVLSNGDGDATLAFTVDGPTVGDVLDGFGGVIQAIRVTDRAATVVVDLPRRSDVAEVTAAVRDVWPATTIRSKSRIDTDGRPPVAVDELTDKQREALRMAYHAGFFARPQEATGNDVADLLDVSRSTALKHVRTAERKVLAELFE